MYNIQHSLELIVQSIEKLLLKSIFIVVQYNIITIICIRCINLTFITPLSLRTYFTEIYFLSPDLGIRQQNQLA